MHNVLLGFVTTLEDLRSGKVRSGYCNMQHLSIVGSWSGETGETLVLRSFAEADGRVVETGWVNLDSGYMGITGEGWVSYSQGH